MTSTVRAVPRLVLLLTLTLLALPVYLALARLGRRTESAVARAYWRGVCRIAGLRVAVRGQRLLGHPVLYVANHASYLDIAVLGSVIPAVFVAKSEVAGWPGIGFLARIAGTVFVQRRANHSARQRDVLQRRLDDGESLILFPEGTSNDGNRVLPFKSALFSAAERQGGRLPVQPVSVAYTRLDGMPMGRLVRPFYAWYGDMVLAPHLWAALGLGIVRVEVEFHPPTTVAELGSRKAVAAYCHRVIAEGCAAALAGRPLPTRTTGETAAALAVR